MKRPLPLLLIVAAVLAGACQQSGPHAQSSPASTAVNLHCAAGDAGEYDDRLGWAFCFPATWRALGGEHLQPTLQPKGTDAVFDITDYATGPTNGFFGDIIISTDVRGTAASLTDWINANVGPGLQLQPIQWGNAIEALEEMGGAHRRFALTPHDVVILELHSGAGNLDLESAMSARLQTWRFTY